MKHQTNHQKPKRITAGILAMLLLLSSAILTGYAETLTAGETVQGAFLEAELLAAMAAASNTDLLPVAIWLEPIDTELVEEIALEQTGLNKQVIRDMAEAGTDGQLTAEQVDAYIAAERSVYAKLQTKANEAFLTSKASVLSQNFDQRNVFVSAYSPMIVAEMTKSEIAILANDMQIQSMSYAGKIPAEDSVLNNEPTDLFAVVPENNPKDPATAAGANYVRDTLGFAGSGIKIGQIELATPNPDETYFTGENITIRSGRATYGTSGDKLHANAVASIIVAKECVIPDETNEEPREGWPCEGIVPDAKLYCTAISVADPDNIDLYENIEWLLSKGVHVINMSAGDFVDSGNYTSSSKWIDHLAINHSVHFIVSAGNWDAPELPGEVNFAISHITHPGMSYNAIVVGATNYSMTSRASFSCYTQSQAQCANKPDLVALGEYVKTAATIASAEQRAMTCGTSFSAPAVTGIVAQLLQAKPALRVLQDVTKAILTASIDHSILRYTTSTAHETQFDECGAGLVNGKTAIENALAGNYFASSFTTSAISGATNTHTFMVNESDGLVRVSLSWLKYNHCGSSHLTEPTEYNLSNLNLTIYDSNYNIVASSACNSGNLEIVEFVPESGGRYTIVISYLGDSLSKTYYGVSWW